MLGSGFLSWVLDDCDCGRRVGDVLDRCTWWRLRAHCEAYRVRARADRQRHRGSVIRRRGVASRQRTDRGSGSSAVDRAARAVPM
jgi:hypothetical protein